MLDLHSPPRTVSWFAESIQIHRDNFGPYTGSASGRGFLLAGGGPYEAGNYVAASMLGTRSRLPIVLLRRADEPLRAGLFEELGVQVITLAPEISASWPNGWPIKSYALTTGILPFSDVHFVDSDVVPWGDPEKAFEAENGAWACTNYHEAIQWDKYGLKPAGFPIDGGVWRLDCKRHWNVAWLYDWLNRHAARVSYQYGVGDQDQLRAAMAACGVEPTLGGTTRHQGPGFIHDAGYTHRYADKFRTRGGHRLGHWPWPQKHTGIPGEKEAYGYFKEYWKLSAKVAPVQLDSSQKTGIIAGT